MNYLQFKSSLLLGFILSIHLSTVLLPESQGHIFKNHMSLRSKTVQNKSERHGECRLHAKKGQPGQLGTVTPSVCPNPAAMS